MTGAAGFFSVHIHRQIGGESRKVFLPSRGVVEGAAKYLAGLGIVGDGGLIWLLMFHWVVSFVNRVVKLVVHYTLGAKRATSASRGAIQSSGFEVRCSENLELRTSNRESFLVLLIPPDPPVSRAILRR